MSQLMFLGAGNEHVKAIQKAQEAGYEILAIEKDPQAAACFEADEFFPVDIHDHNTALEIARASGVEGVLPLSDESIKTASFISQQMNLPGLSEDTAFHLRDVAGKRTAWEQSNLPYLGCADLDRWHQLMSNGRGALVESLTQDGETAILAVSDTERERVGDYYTNKKHNYPAVFDDETQYKIAELVKDGFAALRLQWGAGHSELLITDDEIYLLNQYARPGEGPVFSIVVDQLCGISYVSTVCALMTGQPVSLNGKANGGCCYAYINPPQGQIKAISGMEEAKQIQGVLELELTLQPGDASGAIGRDDPHPGYVVTKGKTRDEARSNAEKVLQQIRIEIV